MLTKNKAWLYGVMTIAGAVAFYLGWFVWTGEAVKPISGLGIGLGAALFCLGLGNIISTFIVSKTETEAIRRRKQIEVADERNTRIREKVGAKINQVVVYALSVVVLAMGMLRVDMIAILLVSSIFLLELVLAIALTDYYSKRI